MYLAIYALSICFFSLLVLVCCVAWGAYDLMRLRLPTLALSGWEYARHQSNDAFWVHEQSKRELPERPAESELTQRREASLASEQRAALRQIQQGLVQRAIFVVVLSVVYVAHWRLAHG